MKHAAEGLPCPQDECHGRVRGAPDIASEVLSPSSVIKIHEVRIGNGMLRRREPLRLIPKQLKNGRGFSVHFDDLDIPLTDSSLEELEDQIKEVLSIAWEIYVLGNPDDMMPDAKKLAERLREKYEQI